MSKKIKMLLVFSFSTVTLFTLFGTSSANAAVRNVPSQHPSIQSAINSSSNGDIIIVAAGIYREQLSIIGKYVEIRSAGDRDNTVLAPNPGKTGIMIQEVPFRSGTPQVKISNIRITGGYSPDGQGGAVTIANNADPVIENNLIDNNTSTVHGGGILVYNNSNPSIKNNTITNNNALTFGGGIFVVKNSSPIIFGNTITNNRVSGASIPNGGSSGGGIYLENEVTTPQFKSNPVVLGNTITNNNAQFAGGGIMLRVGVNAIIDGNVITGNDAPYGGGVHVETEGSNPTIANNQINNNTSNFNPSFPGSGHGAGISVYASSNPLIKSNTITGNVSAYGGAGVVLAEGSNSTITSNVIGNNSVTATGGNTEGGGIYIANATARVKNNVIHGNSGWNGGGIGVLGNSTIDIINNTIVQNNDTNPNIGGGLFVENANVAVTVSNNIFALNQDYQVYEGGTNKAAFTNNIFRNDGTGLYRNAFNGPITTAAGLDASSNANATNSIDSDPQLVNPNSQDYKIGALSPAINAGSNTNAPLDDQRNALRQSGAIDIGAFEYTASTNFKKPVYRFWSEEFKGHFYTHNKAERDAVASGYPVGTWRYEYVAFDAFETQEASTVPIYRIWNVQFRAHAYVLDIAERNNAIQNGWADEGITYYAYPTSYGGDADNVYRFWSPTYLNHFYTADTNEYNYVKTSFPSSIWTDEGIRYKVPKNK